MSLKPLKKSDLEKDWMKTRRDKAIRIQPEYHLIVTEGTKTEPQYFQAVRDIINRQYRGKIQLDIFGEGDNTLSLFEKAKSRVSQNANGYKHVWIVYDTDDFPADHINRTAELCAQNSTDDIQYHAIWSNQCIELWYLLHFSYFIRIFIDKVTGLNLPNGLKISKPESIPKDGRICIKYRNLT